MVLRPHSQLVRARGAALPTSNPDMRPSIRPLAVALAIFGLLSASLPLAAAPAAASVHDLILRVGEPDEMKTRNPLPSIANDAATRDVHGLVHDVPLRTSPEGTLVPYIAKGVDFDEDGTFEASEYGVFAERSGAATPLVVDVYYDFNGVRWHDGVQMTPWDLFFSYHVNAQNSRYNTDLRVLFPSPWGYEAGDRKLNIERFDVDTVTPSVQRNWEGEGTMFGGQNNPLRVGVRFTLTSSFALFYESTLAPIMMPMHIWSRTGGGRHATSDFGCAVWIPPGEANARGILECGNADPTRRGDGIASTETVTGSRPYHYPSAEGWAPTNGDVIGHGPFTFGRWVPGIEASIRRYDEFYTGVDATTGDVYDARLASIIKLPTIEGIRYKIYKTTQLGVFALQSGDIDFYHWNVGAEFVPDLVKTPGIAVESNAEPGFFYLAYNMRDAPWGYEGDNPAMDAGYGFRQAMSHLIDRRSIVQNLLQNFGVIGHGTVSPANTFWYNDNIPKPGFDLAAARAILDDIATPGGLYYDSRYSLDPPGACHKDNVPGCRSLPVIGKQVFEIVAPRADYDPVRALAGAMITDAMRQVGLNVRTTPILPDFRVCMRDFDLLLLGWRISGTDPDYLFSFFHSSNTCGQNYPGVRNATLDAVIDASRSEMDRNVRQQLIHEAQLILADIRPYEVLYYRTSVEPYRQNRFVNWTVNAGTIWNYWSLLSIRPPTEPALRLRVDAPLQVAAGSESPISIGVRATDDLAVPFASLAVEVVATSGEPGVLVANGTAANSLVLDTDAGGSASLLYRAPAGVTGSPRQVRILITASRSDFPAVSWESAIGVFPETVGFLRVTVDYPAGDLARPGVAIPIRIEVADSVGRPMPDAQVAIETSDSLLLRPARPSGDGATLRETFLLVDPGIAETTTFTVTVRASREGFGESVVTTRVTVAPEPRLKLCPEGYFVPTDAPCPVVSSSTQDAPLVWAATGTVIAVATAVALAILRKSRR